MDSFSVILFGDTQEHNDIARRIIALAVDLQPDLCIILGDLVGTGRDLDQWEECSKLLEPLQRSCEVVALPGNHDYESAGIAHNFSARFRLPGVSTYMSLRRGGCRFILLDTMLYDRNTLECGYFPPDSPQAVWLKEELEQAKVLAEPAFVCGHHPVFMSTEIYRCTSPTIRADDCSDELEPGNLLPVLLDGGAQMYFAGHLHLYEKSKYQAMHFITSGATSYDPPKLQDGGNRFGELRLEKNHLCRLDLGRDRIRFQAVDEWSEVIDEWEEPLRARRAHNDQQDS